MHVIAFVARHHNSTFSSRRPFTPALTLGMAGELLRRSSNSMLPSYHRSSSTGVELEPLFKESVATTAASSPSSPTGNGDVTAVLVDPPPSNYNALRDLFISFGFFMLGWWGPKFILPSEEYLQDRKIPYQILNSTNELVLDLSLDNPLVRPPTVPCKSITDKLFSSCEFLLTALYFA